MQFAFKLIILLTFSFSSSLHHFTYEGKINGVEKISFDLGEVRLSKEDSHYKFDYNYTGYVMEEGMPELPIFSTFIEIEPGFDYSVNYTVIKTQSHKNRPIKAAAELTLDKDKHNQGLKRILEVETIFPNSQVKISEPMVMRGLEVINLEVTPFSFNPSNNELISFNIIDLEIIKVNSRQEIRSRVINKNILDDEIFQNKILNYSRTTDEFIPPVILYICGGNIENNSNFQDLVQWKHKRGYNTIVESVSNIGNSTTSIKNYIQNAYNSWVNPPSFVCLVGDANGNYSVPTYTEYQSSYNGEGDHPYSQLDGNDLIPDIAIGRLPIRNLDDMATISSKIIGYEKAYSNLQGQNEWFERAALLGDPSDSGISTIITNEYIEQIMEFNGVEDIQTNYGNGSYSSWMRNQISSGVSYFNYRGFYGVSGFDNNDIDNTSNGFKLPFITTMTCGTGSFAGSEGPYDYCLSEKFVVAGSASNPKGGVAAIATATIGTHTMYNNAMNLGVYEGIYTHNVATAGEALNYGKYHLINSYIGQTQTYTSIFCHWHSLMGDPSLHLWTDTPFNPQVNYNEEIPDGSNSIIISVHDENGIPVENALITLLKGNDEIFISKLTNENGHANIPLEYSTIGEVLITVTKKNMFPYEGNFRISNNMAAAVLNESQILIIEQDGNNDGNINPGETISLNLPIINVGNIELTNVSAELTSLSNLVEISNSSQQYGTNEILPNETSLNNEYFEIYVNPNANDFEDLNLILTITNGNDYWQSTVYLDIIGSQISVGNLIINGSNTNLNNSGSSYLSLYLNNNGRLGLENINGNLYSLSAGVNIINSNVSWSNIGANSSGGPTNTLEIEVMDGVINGAISSFQIDIFNEEGLEKSYTFNLTVGQINIEDPLGPDSYGYYIYDSGDTGYDLAPSYDWIEIDPNYGGNGDDLNISDNGDNQDDSKIINLPFTFRFYGIDYNQITVCSNGWIAFGETNMESFRNYNLPGAGGPSPMLAVFWDDLKTTNGGDVFSEYIEPQFDSPGMFIIEWSDVRTYDANSVESFQAILFQNAVLPNFDGEIKLQYKEFNNTTNGDLGGGWSSPPLHGSYCTVGIENHSGLIGLEYTFNNLYPESAMPLNDETALFITTQTGETLPPADILVSEQDLTININTGDTYSGSLSIENIGEEGSILLYSLNSSQFLNPGGEVDQLGMNWSDSDREAQIEFNWFDISEDNTILDFPHNDEAADPIDLPFLFPFYGYNYSSFIVNANGWVGFASDNDSWSNTAIPNDDAPRPAVFAFWDDLNPISDGGGCSGIGSGTVYYKNFSDKVVITFDEVAYCSGTDDGLYTFQIILYPNGKVEVNYYEMIGLLSSATIGIQNGNGTVAQQVTYNNNYARSELKLVFDKSPSWLSFNSELQGQIFSGDILDIIYTINSDNLIPGTYSAFISIGSNAGPVQVIPVELNINNFSGLLGDINEDGFINVTDIVVIVSFILNQADPSEYESWAADTNGDGLVNVVDIVVMIDIILGNI